MLHQNLLITLLHLIGFYRHLIKINNDVSNLLRETAIHKQRKSSSSLLSPFDLTQFHYNVYKQIASINSWCLNKRLLFRLSYVLLGIELNYLLSFSFLNTKKKREIKEFNEFRNLWNCLNAFHPFTEIRYNLWSQKCLMEWKKLNQMISLYQRKSICILS